MPRFPLFLHEEIKNNHFKQGVFHFGSFTIRFNYSLNYYKDFIEELFRLWMDDNIYPEDLNKYDAELFMFLSPEAFLPRYQNPENPILYFHPEENWYQIRSVYVNAYIDLSADPIQIYVPISPEGKPREPLINFIQAVLNKVLFVLGKIHIHTAAIEFNGSANLFVGDKGAGKTTISMSLAKNGGVILGEDHIIISRKGQEFYASGCDDVMRVTEKTEKYFFDQELLEEIQDFDGVDKKQIYLSNYFPCKLYTDSLISRIFFPKVDTNFLITPVDKSFFMIYFLQNLRPRNRFADNSDIQNLLDYLEQLINSVPAYSLELSKDLRDLDQLAKFIQKNDE